MEWRHPISARGPRGVEAAEIEGEQRWERRETVLPDGTVETVTPMFCRLRISLSDGRVFEDEKGDYYECLLAVREQLERAGLTLCVQGAKRNAWSSSMSRNMGGGWKVYLLEPGRRPSMKDVVSMLDPAECDEVATVAEQRAWVRHWLEGRPDSSAPHQTSSTPDS